VTRVRATALLFASALALVGGDADAAITLKIGTLAPSGSPWATAFQQISDAISTDSHGEVTLDVRYGYGDEIRMVSDVRSGQLDGAALTALGLGQIDKDVLAFELPGLFTTWSKLEAARKAMKPELDAEFEKRGFHVLGWGDIGAAKIMSNGYAVRVPTDLRGHNTFVIGGDPIGPAFFAKLGGVTPKAITFAEILPGLSNGSIDIVLAPALAAEQLQWTSRITHINTMTIGFGIGALVVTSSKYGQVPEAMRKDWEARGGATGDKLSAAVRSADARSFARLKSRKTAYDPTDAERAEWKKLFDDTAAQLRGTYFTPAVYDRVVALAR
jgi:TRAP-type C4-dicarboxylate transport system substrate-binding protein